MQMVEKALSGATEVTDEEFDRSAALGITSNAKVNEGNIEALQEDIDRAEITSYSVVRKEILDSQAQIITEQEAATQGQENKYEALKRGLAVEDEDSDIDSDADSIVTIIHSTAKYLPDLEPANSEMTTMELDRPIDRMNRVVLDSQAKASFEQATQEANSREITMGGDTQGVLYRSTHAYTQEEIETAKAKPYGYNLRSRAKKEKEENKSDKDTYMEGTSLKDHFGTLKQSQHMHESTSGDAQKKIEEGRTGLSKEEAILGNTMPELKNPIS